MHCRYGHTRGVLGNILQAYPSIGSGMNYDGTNTLALSLLLLYLRLSLTPGHIGHGLMWAESPWSGECP